MTTRGQYKPPSKYFSGKIADSPNVSLLRDKDTYKNSSSENVVYHDVLSKLSRMVVTYVC